MALNYNNSFIEDVRTITQANIKDFCHTFFKLYITGNQDLLDRLFHAHSCKIFDSYKHNSSLVNLYWKGELFIFKHFFTIISIKNA